MAAHSTANTSPIPKIIDVGSYSESVNKLLEKLDVKLPDEVSVYGKKLIYSIIDNKLKQLNMSKTSDALTHYRTSKNKNNIDKEISQEQRNGISDLLYQINAIKKCKQEIKNLQNKSATLTGQPSNGSIINEIAELNRKIKELTNDCDIIETKYNKIQKSGIMGDYIGCKISVNNIKNKYVPDLATKYEYQNSLGGGKSGAYVFLVKDIDTKELKILKLYALRINGTIGDRDEREIFTTCSMSGTYGFPIVYDYGMTDYNYKSGETKSFWHQYYSDFFQCVEEKDRISNIKLYTKVYYIVTSLSSGMELAKYDLTKARPEQLISIIYQLSVIFNSADNNMDYFRHNDLHPGNIFIDDKYEDIIYYDKSDREVIPIKGPKVSIIDFDLAITYDYDENLAKGRKIAGQYIIQQATIELLNKYLGLENTIFLIDHTKNLGGITGNDDFRLLYLYFILFETIIHYKIIYPGDHNVLEPSKSIGVIKFVLEEKIISGNTYDAFLTYFRSVYKNMAKIYSVENNRYISEKYNKYVSVAKQPTIEPIVFIRNIADNFNKVSKYIWDAVPDYIKSRVNGIIHELDTNVYNHEPSLPKKQNFGLHNYRITIKLELDRSRVKNGITINSYKDGVTTPIKITSSAGTDTVSIHIGYDGEKIYFESNNLNYSELLSGSHAFTKFIASRVAGPDKFKIDLNLKTGVISGTSAVISIVAGSLKDKIKQAVNCPGAPQFDIKEFVFNNYGNIEFLLNNLYNGNFVEDTRIIISDKGDNVREEIKNINLLELFTSMHNSIDDNLAKQIMSMGNKSSTQEPVYTKIMANSAINVNKRNIIERYFKDIPSVSSFSDLMTNVAIANMKDEKIKNIFMFIYNKYINQYMSNIIKLDNTTRTTVTDSAATNALIKDIKKTYTLLNQFSLFSTEKVKLIDIPSRFARDGLIEYAENNGPESLMDIFNIIDSNSKTTIKGDIVGHYINIIKDKIIKYTSKLPLIQSIIIKKLDLYIDKIMKTDGNPFVLKMLKIIKNIIDNQETEIGDKLYAIINYVVYIISNDTEITLSNIPQHHINTTHDILNISNISVILDNNLNTDNIKKKIMGELKILKSEFPSKNNISFIDPTYTIRTYYLTVDTPQTGGDNFKHKYLKYKKKYLMSKLPPA